MLCLERAVAGTATDLAAPLEQVAATVRKRGMVVLISDLLGAARRAANATWATCARRGTRWCVLRVLDPAEIEFRFDKPRCFSTWSPAATCTSIRPLPASSTCRTFSGTARR